VPYPPDLAGSSLLPVLNGQPAAERERLFAQNDRAMTATFGRRYKLVQTLTDAGPRYALYDRERDPQETRDVARELPDALRVERRELELFLEATSREWRITQRLTSGVPASTAPLSHEACERLKALGYVDSGTPCPP
jgi:arylsulfatase A-like enzyme